MPREISQSKLVAAEGKSTKLVIEHHLRYLQVRGIQVEDFKGHPGFAAQIRAVRKLSGFEQNVRSFAVIRDAEQNAAAAFQSVCDALRDAGLPVPPEPGARAANGIEVAVFILPNNRDDGMLETLCVQSVVDDPAMDCVQKYFECVHSKRLPGPTSVPKAQAQAFLASRPVAGLAVGWAAAEEHRYWNWEHGAFAPLREFLRAI
jgi:hypothetical protein